MGMAELSVWAAFYGSTHDPAAQQEKRLMRQLGWMSYYITAAAGAKVTPQMFVDLDDDANQVDANGPEAAAAFVQMLKRRGYEVK